mmetsp:Transcript_53275/g.127444  ORF Transcript_53275/g.127444 Transcript_53275/m.127444 type:complete len:226 (+) Transcript_53275:381-1058(+)
MLPDHCRRVPAGKHDALALHTRPSVLHCAGRQRRLHEQRHLLGRRSSTPRLLRACHERRHDVGRLACHGLRSFAAGRYRAGAPEIFACMVLHCGGRVSGRAGHCLRHQELRAVDIRTRRCHGRCRCLLRHREASNASGGKVSDGWLLHRVRHHIHDADLNAVHGGPLHELYGESAALALDAGSTKCRRRLGPLGFCPRAREQADPDNLDDPAGSLLPGIRDISGD